ncbi:MAG: peptidyl-prolyl cis-trans isomerase [Gallionella sp.]|nr:peptidyl-prolyl cis-trans isomerase [Gallionella sp.]
MLKAGEFTGMKNLSALAIFGVLAVNTAFAADKPAAVVNGVAISQARVDQRVKAAAAVGQADSPELRKAIREGLISVEVLVQEAVKQRLDKNAEVAQKIVQEQELARQQVLVDALTKDYAKKHPISEKQLKQEYDKQKAQLGNKEYNARHILVGTEAEAKDIIAQLDKKAPFDKLAVKSKDAGSAAQGGSLGWAAPGKFVPPFGNALRTMKKGEYSKKPVQSQFGWHVIKLDDIRDLKLPSFEQARQQLKQTMEQQAVQKQIADLRAKAKIE